MSPQETLTIEQLEARFETQNDLEARLGEIFSARDEEFLGQMRDRLSAVIIKQSFLGDAIRRGKSTDVVAARAATVYSWLAAVGRHAGITIQSSLELKFPSKCAYCGSLPCSCIDATRGVAQLPTKTDENSPRTVRGWQEHLEALYGENNRVENKGVWFTVFRMMDESSEMLILEMNKDQDQLPEDDFKREMQLELADATAWLIATCNLTGVDLQRAVLEKYGNGCVKCGLSRCKCGMHYFDAESVR